MHVNVPGGCVSTESLLEARCFKMHGRTKRSSQDIISTEDHSVVPRSKALKSPLAVILF